MTNESLTRTLARLVTDGGFQRFAALQEQPNLFRAIARTHTETWHSAFLGWLLDPLGSHGLGSFPLHRFLATAADAPIPPDAVTAPFLTPDELAHFAAARDVSEATVLPNEYSPTEHTFSGGRADVWIEIAQAESAPGLFVFVEMKVDAPLSKDQCKKYADYVISRATESKAVCIFLARSDDLSTTSTETVSDPNWYCIDFQALHDEVVEPCRRHPTLSPQMAPLVEHYLLNMRDLTSPRGRMAITKEERDMALAIYEKHASTFRALAEILKDEDGFPAGLTSPAEDEVPLALTADGATIKGESVPEFLTAVFDHIYKTKNTAPSLPFATGKKRYLLAETSTHPSGKQFINPRDYATPAGATLKFEANTSRPAALAAAKKILASVKSTVA